MTVYNIEDFNHKEINELLNETPGDCTLTGCLGQRFIAAGMSDKTVIIEGVPGNALGAYLNGANIIVNANAQDAVGDTMNDGKIVIYGNIGDAAGYAMRGGKIYVKGNAGYRAGIHMKSYKEKIEKTKRLSEISPAQACMAAKCIYEETAVISSFPIRLLPEKHRKKT